METNNYSKDTVFDARFYHPSTILISGVSSSGKHPSPKEFWKTEHPFLGLKYQITLCLFIILGKTFTRKWSMKG